MHFLNVDLEIESHQNLQPIVEGLGDKVMNLYCGKAQDHYLATFELSDVSAADPDSIISNFCLLIENLEGEGKKLWDSAFAKVFDIGYEAGLQPSSYSSEISPGTIKKISMLGASIRVTIYPHSSISSGG
ncbi:hypothetical protein [Calothrix sp. NIES-3974]|uniref:hypothetical protein n=1 Tax=Calothrix sp. NIES-3974 TaxID=2005462 RepID=UPI000B607C1A|nr:hypothetical protein [Calothrix sp. NIES-3974]BAZ06510.1 hypothetical protein NIES3974_31710 [Calothrix sp. NIES-3974]